MSCEFEMSGVLKFQQLLNFLQKFFRLLIFSIFLTKKMAVIFFVLADFVPRVFNFHKYLILLPFFNLLNLHRYCK